MSRLRARVTRPEDGAVFAEHLVLRDEPLRRGSGKPHMVECLARTGGETVYVTSRHPNGPTGDAYQFERIVGMDVSLRSLKIASERLRLDRVPPMKRRRIDLMHGSLMYRDSRLTGFDAATCVEVVEHLDPPRLAAFERVVFEFARPQTVTITTPNREYNVKFVTLLYSLA